MTNCTAQPWSPLLTRRCFLALGKIQFLRVCVIWDGDQKHWRLFLKSECWTVIGWGGKEMSSYCLAQTVTPSGCTLSSRPGLCLSVSNMCLWDKKILWHNCRQWNCWTCWYYPDSGLRTCPAISFPLPHSLLFKDLVSLVLKIPNYYFLWLRHVSADSCSSFNISSLFQDHIQEVLNKWQSIDDEIWAKIIVLERNRWQAITKE